MIKNRTKIILLILITIISAAILAPIFLLNDTHWNDKAKMDTSILSMVFSCSFTIGIISYWRTIYIKSKVYKWTAAEYWSQKIFIWILRASILGGLTISWLSMFHETKIPLIAFETLLLSECFIAITTVILFINTNTTILEMSIIFSDKTLSDKILREYFNDVSFEQIYDYIKNSGKKLSGNEISNIEKRYEIINKQNLNIIDKFKLIKLWNSENKSAKVVSDIVSAFEMLDNKMIESWGITDDDIILEFINTYNTSIHLLDIDALPQNSNSFFKEMSITFSRWNSAFNNLKNGLGDGPMLNWKMGLKTHGETFIRIVTEYLSSNPTYSEYKEDIISIIKNDDDEYVYSLKRKLIEV